MTTALKSRSDQVTNFGEDLWSSLVKYLTVYVEDDLRFALSCEIEITV